MASQGTEPNLFELTDYGTSVTYSTTSIAGQPQLTYRDEARELSFSGPEIETLDIGIGVLVTVTLEVVPDSDTTTFSLLLPAINLDDGETAFETQGILTTHRSSIGGPGLLRGALQTYSVLPLRGTARLVAF